MPSSVMVGRRDFAGNLPRSFRAILQRSGGRIAIQSTHSYPEQRPASEKLLVGIAEAGPQL